MIKKQSGTSNITLFLYLGIFTLVLLLGACVNQDTHNQVKEYLFLSHIYQWGVIDNNRIDFRLKGHDFAKYDQVWLGGDICARTNEDPATLTYLDSIFDLSAPSTHWTLGNHDIKHGPLKRIENITGRKTYYTTYFDGLTLSVINTNEFHDPNYKPKDHECALLQGQIEMLENIADTITHSSHFILLHHLCLLTNKLTNDSLNLNQVFNLYKPDLRVDCEGIETFETAIYPILKKIQDKGVKVILISGDLGQRSKAFEYQTEDGIWFLGSGINNSAIEKYIPEYVTDTSPDKVLLLERDLIKRSISWHFIMLNDIL